MNKKPWIIVGILVAILAIPCIVRMLGDDDTPTVIPIREEENDSHQDTDSKVIEVKGMPDKAIGEIEIESLNIRYPIYEGDSEAQLSIGIGHLRESAPLLATGNCVLCGHNGSSKGLFFTTLSHIRKGEPVKITTNEKPKRERIYRVKSTKVVGPCDPSVRRESEKEVLTLFTCAYHGTRRFVAVCEPDEPAEPVNTADKGEEAVSLPRNGGRNEVQHQDQ